jgi:uncharacterized protein YbjT (DUF2867 family)
MTEKMIIAVVGATGSQGGGLVRAILADTEGPFAARALTRNAHSSKARELASQGADVVEADLDDEASVHRAFDGAYGAFVVTNFWAQRTPDEERARTRAEMELAQAAAAARAAKDTGLRHVVWSTLEDTRVLLPIEDPRMPVLQGNYNVPHFDAKAEGNEIFAAAGVPTTYLNTTFFYQGFLQPLRPQHGEDGVLTLTLPFEDGKLLAGVDVDDIGRTAFAILAAGDTYIGETIGLAGDHLTGAQYAEQLAEVIGEPVRFQSVPYDVFRGLPIPAAEELANMFQYYGDFDAEFTGARDLERLRQLNPHLKDFKTWTRENADALRAA